MATSTTYDYKVRDGRGTERTGTIDAETKEAAASRLRATGVTVVSIEPAGGAGLSKQLTVPGRGNRVKLRDLAVFSRQFATLINAGLPIIRTLGILSEQTQSKLLGVTLNQVAGDVERGQSLSQAMSGHPRVFDRLYVSVVRAGEASGELDKVLLQQATVIEKTVALRRKVRSAMTYPVGVLILVLIIMIAMLTFVVPKFKDLFAQVGSELPLPTQMLLTGSNLIRTWWWALILAVAGLVFAFRRYRATRNGRLQVDRFKLKAPVFGQLAHKASMARFSRTLASLLGAGVNLLPALEMTGEAVGNRVIEDSMVSIRDAVRDGRPMSSAMAQNSVFPRMSVQMLAVGEETGEVDGMLLKVAEFYEGEVEALVESLTSLLEPLLMAFLGSTVGVMVVALYLPMFDIITKVK